MNWTNTSFALDEIKNSVVGSPPAARVFIDVYTAYAKQTKPSTNAKVYQGDDGIGDVVAGGSYQTNQWCLLAESLIGKVVTSADARNRVAYSVLSKTIRQDGVLLNQMSPIHSPIDLGRPSNNSPVVKALPYWHIKNQQMIPHIAFNELIWGSPTYITQLGSATSWSAGSYYQVTSGAYKGYYKCEGTFNDSLDGNAQLHKKPDFNLYFNDNLILRNLGSASGFGDDDTMRIIDGVGIYNNRHGDSCLYGTHELAIPCGFVKNVAKAGEA
ncbi:hypothetical protein [Vibrio mediterranei]|uniref:hypothetical protein n=1 Tax=Vibrio mediterranei TaxID=689 RepID=UPI00148E8D03|nr:hypothetical protein [Vibrio mediterranei]NOH27864.1 hypothetical protein [Vibrio mediterranei]